MISAPQRGVKGAIAPTAPEREPKNAPAKAGENSPRGNCVPPCRATASPSHRTRPPLWACGPPIRLTAVGSPCWLSRKEGSSPPRCAQKKENALAGLPGRPWRGDQGKRQGKGRRGPFARLVGRFGRSRFPCRCPMAFCHPIHTGRRPFSGHGPARVDQVPLVSG